MTLPTSALVVLMLAAASGPPPPGPPDRDAIERFLARTGTPFESAVTFRHLEATARGGSLRGWVDACAVVEGRQMRYSIVAQGGSSAVRRRALMAALDGEANTRRQGDVGRASLHPDNYEFAPAGTAGALVRVAISPRRRDAMLVRGAMYLAPEDADLVRVEGTLEKAPSIWTRRVRVDRRYARLAGVRVPVSMTSTAHVFIVGDATFSMTYSYLAINGAPVADPHAPPESRACVAPAALGEDK